MDSIATELGISKKTIYQHFPDKDSIVQQVMETFIVEDKKKWEALELRYTNVIEKMFASMEILKETLSEINPHLLFEIQKYFPKTFETFEQYKQVWAFGKMKSDFQNGIKYGYFRSDVDVDLLAHLRIAEIDLVFNPAFYPQNKLSIFETQSILTDMFMRGILTEKGLVLYNSYQNKN